MVDLLDSTGRNTSVENAKEIGGNVILEVGSGNFVFDAIQTK